MRLLHTSDWHLGPTLRSPSRAGERWGSWPWPVDTVISRAWGELPERALRLLPDLDLVRAAGLRARRLRAEIEPVGADASPIRVVPA